MLVWNKKGTKKDQILVDIFSLQIEAKHTGTKTPQLDP